MYVHSTKLEAELPEVLDIGEQLNWGFASAILLVVYVRPLA